MHRDSSKPDTQVQTTTFRTSFSYIETFACMHYMRAYINYTYIYSYQSAATVNNLFYTQH
jgi:drug/metabolite transporter (DMT)-like permease